MFPFGRSSYQSRRRAWAQGTGVEAMGIARACQKLEPEGRKTTFVSSFFDPGYCTEATCASGKYAVNWMVDERDGCEVRTHPAYGVPLSCAKRRIASPASQNLERRSTSRHRTNKNWRWYCRYLRPGNLSVYSPAGYASPRPSPSSCPCHHQGFCAPSPVRAYLGRMWVWMWVWS